MEKRLSLFSAGGRVSCDSAYNVSAVLAFRNVSVRDRAHYSSENDAKKYKGRKKLSEDNGTCGDELLRSGNISYQSDASIRLPLDVCKVSSRSKNCTSKESQRLPNYAKGLLQTEKFMKSHGRRKETVALTSSARRSHVLSRTVLKATKKVDSQLIVVDEPRNFQQEFQTVSLRGDAPNAESLQRESKRQKIIVHLEHHNSFKKSLADQKETNSFLLSSENLWKAEGERLKKELLDALINEEGRQTL